MVAPVSSSKVQVQLSAPLPVDLVPSSSTGTLTCGPVGAVQIASTGIFGGVAEIELVVPEEPELIDVSGGVVLGGAD